MDIDDADIANEYLLQAIVSTVQYTRLIDTEFSNYFNVRNELVTLEMIKSLYSSFFQRELRTRLGFQRVKFYLSMPDKSALYQNVSRVLGEIHGNPNEALSALLDLPSLNHFEEIELDLFSKSLTSFERKLQKVKTDDPLRFENFNLTSGQVEARFINAHSESVNEDLILGLLNDIIEVMFVIGIRVDIMHQVNFGGGYSNWASDDYNYRDSFLSSTTIKPDFVLTSIVHNIPVLLPIEIKKNIHSLKKEIGSKGNLSAGSIDVLTQCLQYAIHLKSSCFMVSDYFHTIWFELNLDKTLALENRNSDGNVIQIYYKFRIINNFDEKLTLRVFITCMLYHNFYLKDKKTFLKERRQMIKMVELFRTTPPTARLRQLDQNSQLLQELRQSSPGETIELNFDDLKLNVIERSSIIVGSMELYKFKKLFKMELIDQNIKGVIIKIFDPKLLSKRFEVDERALEIAVGISHRAFDSELFSYAMIKAHNQSKSDFKQRIIVPKLLKYGTLIILDKLGIIKNIGNYIAFEKIEKTREFINNDFPELLRQVRILNRDVQIEHRNLMKRNVIVNNERLFLTGFESSKVIDDVRSYRDEKDLRLFMRS